MKLIEQLFSLILYWSFYWLHYKFHFSINMENGAAFILLMPSLVLFVHCIVAWFTARKHNLGFGSFEKETVYRIYLVSIMVFLIIVGRNFYIQGFFTLANKNNSLLDQIWFGIFISVLVGGYLNHWINKLLWRYLSSGERKIKDAYSFVNLLGTLELMVYFFALVIRRPEFIVFWITTKVAVTWQQFAKSIDRMSSHHVFLIGNILNILWATIGVILAFGLEKLIPIKQQ